MLAVWQPLQTDHKDGPSSDMQTAEKRMAERMGITVLEFEFKEDEVNEMNTDGNFKQMDGSFKSPYDGLPAHHGDFLPAVMVRDETAFKKRLEEFLLKHGIAKEMS